MAEKSGPVNFLTNLKSVQTQILLMWKNENKHKQNTKNSRWFRYWFRFGNHLCNSYFLPPPHSKKGLFYFFPQYSAHQPSNGFVPSEANLPINGKYSLGKTSTAKKRFLSGIARMMWGGSTHARIFWPFFRSAFLVNKKSLFLQKCQCIELLTVF